MAEDLGISLSTLVRWIGRSRDCVAEIPGRLAATDTRPERDILKRVTASFAREEVDEGRPS
jgi:transposase